MKAERAAMMALCMVILSPATSKAKSNHGASSRLDRQTATQQNHSGARAHVDNFSRSADSCAGIDRRAESISNRQAQLPMPF